MVVVPPTSVLEASVTDDATGGSIGSVKVLVTAPAVAVTVAVCRVVTGVAVTVKVAEVAPLGTVTEAGTDTTARLDERVTGNPAAGAADVKVTVPVIVPPPKAGLGEIESVLSDWA